MKKILVTGGLGFIGYHLIKNLLEKDASLKITVVDNLSSSVIDFGTLRGKLDVRVQDLLDYESRDYGFSQIYHLASPVGSLGILKMNGFVARNIIDLTYKVVDIAMKNKARLLYVSSSEVYGHSGIHPETAIKQVSGAGGTRLEYALGKLASEVILQNLNINQPFQYNIARPFNVVGAQQCSKIGFVFPTFFEKAMKNEDLPVFLDGSQKRSFCHVEDIVSAMIRIQESELSGEIFNIGNENNTITILELAQRIRSACHSDSKIVHVDPFQKFGSTYLEAFDKIPDITKIRTMLGWNPAIDLENAIQRVYRYYESFLHAAV